MTDLEESVEDANGFKFRHYTAEALLWAVDRAVALYRDNPELWHKMQRNGMRRDFSWDVSAREYVKVYRGH